MILDTNIWISTFIGKRLVGLAEVLKQGQLEPLTAVPQMTELFQVLDRPKLAVYFSHEDKQFIQRFFLRACTLVTGDQDLLVLGQFEGTKIVTFRDFEDTWGLGR